MNEREPNQNPGGQQSQQGNRNVDQQQNQQRREQQGEPGQRDQDAMRDDSDEATDQ